MEVKLRRVYHTNTWYDYKMAVIGTLMDYGLRIRPHGTHIMVYRNIGSNEWNDGDLVYTEKRVAWKDFFENTIRKVIEKELAR